MEIYNWWSFGSRDGGKYVFYSLTGEVFSSPVMFDDQILIGCRDNYLYSLEIINETEK